jgi:phage tail sheath gpL-like
MAISFDAIPSTIRTPFVAIEFDNTAAAGNRPSLQPYKGLLIGQRLSAGSVSAGVPTRISSKKAAETAFGAGSMLAAMADAWFQNNTFSELWAVALDDDGAGVAATATVTVTGTATAAGTLNLYIGGQKVKVGVASGDTPSTVASAIVTAISADSSLPVSASAVAGVVTLTAKHKGEVMNELDLRLNYFSGEELPAGVSVALVAFSGGTTNPDVADMFAAIGDEQFNVIALPYLDAGNIATFQAEMETRFGPLKQIEGLGVSAKNASASSLQAFGDGLNTPHLSVMGCYKVPTAPYKVAASLAAVVTYYGNIDPARPFQTLPLKGVLAPAIEDRFTQSERNSLLFDGVSTHVVSSDGVVRIERLITTYQETVAGAADDSYLDVETMLTLGYLRHDLRTYLVSKYPRHKLASDGIRVAPGQAIVTPKLIKAELLSKFRQWEELGLVENFDQFKRDVIVERNAADPNRLDVLLPPDLINQLRVSAIKVQFRL